MLEAKTKKELSSELKKLLTRKLQLEGYKKARVLKSEEQDELDEAVLKIFDIQESIENIEAAEKEQQLKQEQINLENKVQAYNIKPNEAHLYHLEITGSIRFDQKTGKEISKKFVQTYTIPEFKQVQRFSESLGFAYTILWDPTKNNA